MANDLFKQGYQKVKRVKTSSWNQRHILLAFRTNISRAGECELLAATEMSEPRAPMVRSSFTPLNLQPQHSESRSNSSGPRRPLWGWVDI